MQGGQLLLVGGWVLLKEVGKLLLCAGWAVAMGMCVGIAVCCEVGKIYFL